MSFNFSEQNSQVWTDKFIRIESLEMIFFFLTLPSYIELVCLWASDFPSVASKNLSFSLIKKEGAFFPPNIYVEQCRKVVCVDTLSQPSSYTIKQNCCFFKIHQISYNS